MSNAKIVVFFPPKWNWIFDKWTKTIYITFVILSKYVCLYIVYDAVGLSFCMHCTPNENNIDVNKISNATCHGDEQDSPRVANKNIVYYRYKISARYTQRLVCVCNDSLYLLCMFQMKYHSIQSTWNGLVIKHTPN